MIRRWLVDPRYYWEKRKEHILMWIAWHMPKNITYWCAIRVIAHATQGEWENQEVTELRAIDVLPRWRPEKPINPMKTSNEYR